MTDPVLSSERKDFIMNQNFRGVEPVFGGTLGSRSGDIPSAAGVVGPGVRPLITAPGPASSPPPLPVRTQHNYSLQPSYPQPFSRYMNNNYSSLGMGGYPYNSYGYGGYGSYPRRMMGGYGTTYSGLSGYQDEYDAFMIQEIDESCTRLFGPFDSLVRSVSSIAMVLDSTHQAMQFSFRTVLSAADSLSKLKNLFLELATSFSVIRLLRSLYYKILRLLGLISGKTMKEKQWSEVFNEVGVSVRDEAQAGGKPSPWLALGFFSLMMGGPYLMFKLFAQNLKNPQPKSGLVVGADSLEAVAVFDFEAGTAQELSMKKGDRLKVSKSNVAPGWALATNGTSTGYVPTNRLQLVSARQKVERNYSQFPQRDALVPKAGVNSSGSRDGTAEAMVAASTPCLPDGNNLPISGINEETKQ